MSSVQNLCASEAYSFHRTYGAGFPKALIRDGYVEVFFEDWTHPLLNDDRDNCNWQFDELFQRVRVPLSSLFNASAWTAFSTWSSRSLKAQQGQDMKWSPQLGRYFTLSTTSNAVDQWPLLAWSENAPVEGSLTIKLNEAPYVFNNAPPTYYGSSPYDRWGSFGAYIPHLKSYQIANFQAIAPPQQSTKQSR